MKKFLQGVFSFYIFYHIITDLGIIVSMSANRLGGYLTVKGGTQIVLIVLLLIILIDLIYVIVKED